MAKITMLRVVSVGLSFRRAGHEFTRQPTDLPLADLPAKVVAKLKQERNLRVSEVEVEASEDGSADAAAKAAEKAKAAEEAKAAKAAKKSEAKGKGK